MSRILIALLLLVLVAVGVVFAVMNATPVELNYVLGSREVPLALTLVLTLAFGVLIGVIAAVGMVLACRRELTRLRRQVRVAEQEIANLRTIPIKD